MIENRTFIVKILYAQNSSWQGTIDWIGIKEKKSQCFRSALELIRLLDAAVGTEERKEWEENQKGLSETPGIIRN